MDRNDTLRSSELNVETTGPEEGEPLLLMHGWGSSAELMRPIAQALHDDYRVYNVDLPGHGHSPAPPVPWGVPEHADLVSALIDEQIGGGPVTVVGHSNGGRIALYMASSPEHAHRIRRLVLVSPSGVERVRTWRYHLRRLAADALKAPFQMLPEGELKAFTMDWLRHSLVWKALGSSDYQKLDGVMRDTFVKTVNHYVTDRLGDIDVPVLLFWGTEDDAVTRQQITVMEHLIPNAGVVELEGASHYGYLEAPGTFVSATRHFLEHAGEGENASAQAETSGSQA